MQRAAAKRSFALHLQVLKIMESLALLLQWFFLMAIQGVSEIIKRVAALEHVIDADFKYEKPLQ